MALLLCSSRLCAILFFFHGIENVGSSFVFVFPIIIFFLHQIKILCYVCCLVQNWRQIFIRSESFGDWAYLYQLPHLNFMVFILWILCKIFASSFFLYCVILACVCNNVCIFPFYKISLSFAYFIFVSLEKKKSNSGWLFSHIILSFFAVCANTQQNKNDCFRGYVMWVGRQKQIFTNRRVRIVNFHIDSCNCVWNGGRLGYIHSRGTWALTPFGYTHSSVPSDRLFPKYPFCTLITLMFAGGSRRLFEIGCSNSKRLTFWPRLWLINLFFINDSYTDWTICFSCQSYHLEDMVLEVRCLCINCDGVIAKPNGIL